MYVCHNVVLLSQTWFKLILWHHTLSLGEAPPLKWLHKKLRNIKIYIIPWFQINNLKSDTENCFMFESLNLFPKLKVMENLRFSLSLILSLSLKFSFILKSMESLVQADFTSSELPEDHGKKKCEFSHSFVFNLEHCWSNDELKADYWFRKIA